MRDGNWNGSRIGIYKTRIQTARVQQRISRYCETLRCKRKEPPPFFFNLWSFSFSEFPAQKWRQLQLLVASLFLLSSEISPLMLLPLLCPFPRLLRPSDLSVSPPTFQFPPSPMVISYGFHFFFFFAFMEKRWILFEGSIELLDLLLSIFV